MNQKILLLAGGVGLVGLWYWSRGQSIPVEQVRGPAPSGPRRVAAQSGGSQATRFARAQRARNVANARGVGATIQLTGAVTMQRNALPPLVSTTNSSGLSRENNGGLTPFVSTPLVITVPTGGKVKQVIQVPWSEYQPVFANFNAGDIIAFQVTNIPAGYAGWLAPTIVPPSDAAQPVAQDITFYYAKTPDGSAIGGTGYSGQWTGGGTMGGYEFKLDRPTEPLFLVLMLSAGGRAGYQHQHQ